MVCLGVGDDGLHGHDGLVDLGLQLSQLLDVQQAQDLSRLVQSGVWGRKVDFIAIGVSSTFSHPIQEQTHSPPVSKPRVCLSKVTGTPFRTKNVTVGQRETQKKERKNPI